MPLSPKAKSIIEQMFKGLLFRLSREPVHSLLCAPTYNVNPEQSLGGKIIVFDLPVKDYDKIGKDAQVLFKYVWQRAMERRRMIKHNRPVFLWADEARNFIHDHDIDYQATARSSRICTVYLTQNLPNYFAHMGGHDGEYHVKSFLGTMGTKIFHANADIDTNEYASNLFGEGFYYDESTSHQMAGEFSSSQSRSVSMKKNVRPEQFVSLKTGGHPNNKQVQCYIHKQGTPWVWKKQQDGEVEILSQNFKSLTFKQN